MSSLIGHVLAGSAAYASGEAPRQGWRQWVWAGWLVFLALWPDVDYGVAALRASAHGGLRITHSLAWVLMLPLGTAVALWMAGLRGRAWVGRSLQAVAAGLSHLVLDLLVGVTLLPLFWPLVKVGMRLPFGVLPSAGRPELRNPLFYSNLAIELGALVPLAVLLLTRRGKPLPVWVRVGLLLVSVLFLTLGAGLER